VIRALAIVGMCSVAAAAQPAASPGESPRAAYIAGLLDAIEATSAAMRTNTSNYVYAVERNKCQTADESLRVGCVVTAVVKNCTQSDPAARAQCRRVSDVIATNRLSEPAFLPDDVRFEIMDSHRDFRTALARELHRRYAILVAEFSMSRYFPGSAAGNPALAAGLEAYCRDVAGTRELSWQYCVAATVWFIGTQAATQAVTR
jgi:hypothetical protein